MSRVRRPNAAIAEGVTRYPDESDVLDADDQIGEAVALLAVIGNVDYSLTHPRLGEGIALVVKEAERRLARAREVLTIAAK